MSFLSDGLYGTLLKVHKKDSKKRYTSSEQYDVWCFPLTAILRAINHTIEPIDYFSLDVEGAEVCILEGLPWKSLNIRIMQVYNDIICFLFLT